MSSKSKSGDFLSDFFEQLGQEINKVGAEVSEMLKNGKATSKNKAEDSGGTIGQSIPAINLIETGEEYIVHVAAPGMSKEDFTIGLEEKSLIIASELKTTTDDPHSKYLQQEFNYQPFQRSFSVPESVDIRLIKAAYKEGMLVITLPKKESARTQPKQTIEIW